MARLSDLWREYWQDMNWAGRILFYLPFMVFISIFYLFFIFTLWLMDNDIPSKVWIKIRKIFFKGFDNGSEATEVEK